MKFGAGLFAAFAITGFAGAANAASLDEIVIKGPMAERINEKYQLSVVVAEKLAKHCVAEAASKGLSTSVAVIDQYGTVIYYYRADGQPKGATESALSKARSAWQSRGPTHAQQNQVTLGNRTDAGYYIQGNFPTAGGLPIIVDHQFLGAIGVGGMAANPPVWSDEICANNALTAIIGPQPPLLENAVRPAR